MKIVFQQILTVLIIYISVIFFSFFCPGLTYKVSDKFLLHKPKSISFHNNNFFLRPKLKVNDQ